MVKKVCKGRKKVMVTSDRLNFKKSAMSKSSQKLPPNTTMCHKQNFLVLKPLLSQKNDVLEGL